MKRTRVCIFDCSHKGSEHITHATMACPSLVSPFIEHGASLKISTICSKCEHLKIIYPYKKKDEAIVYLSNHFNPCIQSTCISQEYDKYLEILLCNPEIPHEILIIVTNYVWLHRILLMVNSLNSIKTNKTTMNNITIVNGAILPPVNPPNGMKHHYSTPD